MPRRLVTSIFVLVAILIAAASAAHAQPVPEGYPPSYAEIIAGARKEAKLSIYATTDSASAEPLLRDFKSLYPFLAVEYSDLNSTELYNRFISETAANAGTGDLVWSSAMDLQMKLVADGHAVEYASPEAAKLPPWSIAAQRAYGTTLEPLVFVYNKRLTAEADIPRSHADLIRLANAKTETFKGKIALYDPEKSGVGFLLMTQDAANWPGYWELAVALGRSGAKMYTSAGAMMEKVTSGEHLLAYNIFGSYALLRQQKDVNIGIVYPGDYTLAVSRIAFVSSRAKNPNAAKLFLDYLLSKRGQNVLASKSLLFSIRGDVEGPATASTLFKDLGNRLRPAPVNATLLDMLEPQLRLEMISKWKRTMRGG